MPTENVMDAVNAALGDALEPPADPPPEEVDAPVEEGEAPADDVGGDDAAEGDSEPEAEEGEGEGEGEPEKGPNGERERNPDGTWKKAEPKPEGEKPKEPPKKDPVNDPIPENLKKETSERIRTLIDMTKTATAERDKVLQDFTYMVQGVQATGATPQQYGEALSWLALFNSGDARQQEKALELIESVADRLATLLGKERSVSDPLGQHADLREAVAKGQITAQYAKEIARTRNNQQFRTELSTQAQTQAQQQEQARREEQAGRQALTELEATLRASDPDYDRKRALLVPALRPIMSQIPWSQKKDKFLEAYRALKLPTGATATVTSAVPKNQPLRAKPPAGGQTRAPGSMLEAISGALEGMKK